MKRSGAKKWAKGEAPKYLMGLSPARDRSYFMSFMPLQFGHSPGLVVQS
jgi:hypothetical protein